MNKIFAVAGIVIKELYRRKDFYVLFILTAVITLLLGMASDAARYLKEVCLLLIWICSLVIAATTTARQIPAEKESRTIFPLLAKPISRSQVLLGKFFGCWFASGVALLVFYTFFGVISAWRQPDFPWANYLQAVWLHWQALGIVVAVTLLGSLVMSAPAPNVTVILIASLGVLYSGRELGKVAAHASDPVGSILLALYYAIPHLEFFDVRDLIVHDWPVVPWGDVALVTGYGMGYMSFFLLAACLVFRRKALN